MEKAVKSEIEIRFALHKSTLSVDYRKKDDEIISHLPFADFFRQIIAPNSTILRETRESSTSVLNFLMAGKVNQAFNLSDERQNAQISFKITEIKEDCIFVEFSRRQKKEDSASQIESIDYLTKVYSRSYLFTTLENILEKSEKRECYLIMIDLDNFKIINDSFGHIVGDACLKEIANKLSHIFQGHILGRFGGDEFLAFVDNVDEETLDSLIKQTLNVRYQYERRMDGRSLVTCSMGIVKITSFPSELLSWIEKADEALYQSKKFGKNCAQIHNGKIYRSENAIKPKKSQFVLKSLSSSALFKQEYQNRKRNYLALTLLFIFLFIFAIVAIDLGFAYRTKTLIQDLTSQEMEKNSSSVSALIKQKNDESFLNLSNSKKILDNTKESVDENYSLTLLAVLKDETLLNTPGLLLETGEVLLEDGKVLNMATSTLAKDILISKENQALDMISFINGETRFAFAIPYEKEIPEEGLLIKGIVSLFSQSDYASFVFSGIDETKYIALVDQNGNKICQNDSSKIEFFNSNSNFKEYFRSMNQTGNLEKLTSSLAKKEATMELYTIAESSYFAYTIQIADTSWHLYILTSYETVASTFDPIKNNAMTSLNLTSAVFLILSCVALLYVYRLRNIAFLNKYVDPVTQSINEQRFRLDAQYIKCHQSSTHYLVYFNLKRFKLVNNHLGDEKADELLLTISQALEKECQEDEIVSREYSDHFMLLLKGENNKQVRSRVENTIERLINEIQFTKGVKVAFYIGIYQIEKESKSPIWIAIDRARYACYSIPKSNNSLDICFFDQSMLKNEELEVYIEQAQENALREGKFQVYYQGKYNLHTHAFSACEALVRWKDDNKGFINTQTFIDVFERNSFIIRLDLYVFEAVLKDIRKRLDSHQIVLPTSINLSRKHFDFKDSFKPYEELIEKYQIEGKYLEFEITESIILNSENNLDDTIKRIHNLGAKVSIDDFGSGFSNFSMINHIDYDIIKLDKKLLEGKNGFDEYSKNILATLTKLNKTMNKEVLTEGVETKEESDFLASIGCDLIQGYYYSKPSDPVSFYALVRKTNEK